MGITTPLARAKDFRQCRDPGTTTAITSKGHTEVIQQVAGIAAAQLYRSELSAQPPPQTAADLTREERQGAELLPPVQTSADAAAQGGVQRRSGRPEGRENALEPKRAGSDGDTVPVTLLLDAVAGRDDTAGGREDGSGSEGGNWRSPSDSWEEMGPAVMPVRGGEVAGVFFVADVILKARNCYSAASHLIGGTRTGGLVDLSQ